MLATRGAPDGARDARHCCGSHELAWSRARRTVRGPSSFPGWGRGLALSLLCRTHWGGHRTSNPPRQGRTGCPLPSMSFLRPLPPDRILSLRPLGERPQLLPHPQRGVRPEEEETHQHRDQHPPDPGEEVPRCEWSSGWGRGRPARRVSGAHEPLGTDPLAGIERPGYRVPEEAAEPVKQREHGLGVVYQFFTFYALFCVFPIIKVTNARCKQSGKDRAVEGEIVIKCHLNAFLSTFPRMHLSIGHRTIYIQLLTCSNSQPLGGSRSYQV